MSECVIECMSVKLGEIRERVCVSERERQCVCACAHVCVFVCVLVKQSVCVCVNIGQVGGRNSHTTEVWLRVDALIPSCHAHTDSTPSHTPTHRAHTHLVREGLEGLPQWPLALEGQALGSAVCD